MLKCSCHIAWKTKNVSDNVDIFTTRTYLSYCTMHYKPSYLSHLNKQTIHLMLRHLLNKFKLCGEPSRRTIFHILHNT